LDNAIKFSQDERKQVVVSVRAVDEWVEIAVQDEGIGIAAKEIPHLFKRFRQINREATEQQGAGLGLAIAQELIKLHGGEITVNSRPGEGAAFTIRLPVAKEEA
jgi:signal transduction histidine kinase